MKEILITKASGETAAFNSDKLKHSLHRSGATNEVIDDIVTEVRSQLYDGITTKKIYQIAFGILRKQSKKSASKYKLKRAIMELGPTGFPFEKYIGELLRAEGYQIKVGQIVKGQCVNHEIDVIAEKENHHFMVECKFHNQPGINCDVKIPLYIHARFKDVELQWKSIPGHGTKFHQGWVVTNTKFSGDAIQYGRCAGLYLLGWDYPVGNSLREKIDVSGLYPITCLTSITLQEKQQILSKGFVLCMEICDKPTILDVANIPSVRRNAIINEAKALCRNVN